MQKHEIQNSLAKGELFRGKIYVDRNMPENAKIMNNEYGIQIQINGYENMNRALNGDVVAVRLFEK